MDRRIEIALQVIDQNYSDPLDLKRIAHGINLSICHFEYLFKREMGRTYKGYLREVRVTKAKDLLMDLNLSVKQVASIVGYSHTSNFIRAFKTQFGKTPSDFRNRVS